MAIPFVVTETFEGYLENHVSLYQFVAFETEKEKQILHELVINQK